MVFIFLNHICVEIISKVLNTTGNIITVQSIHNTYPSLLSWNYSSYPGTFKDITHFSRLSIFKPPYILPCIITFRLMRSHLEPHINWKKSLVRLFKVSILGLGRAINRWFNFGIIKVFKTVTLPMGVKILLFHCLRSASLSCFTQLTGLSRSAIVVYSKFLVTFFMLSRSWPQVLPTSKKIDKHEAE